MKNSDPRFHRLLLLILLLANVLSLAALDPQKYISQYIHKKWTTDDSLPQQIFSIAQTPDGYIWLGTAEGLLVFDGIKFSKHEIPSLAAKKSNYAVHNIISTTDGTLWADVSNTGIFRLHDGRAELLDTNRGLSSNLIWTLILDPVGRLWIGTEEAGLNLYQEGRVTVFTVDQGLASNYISVLYFDRQSTLWVGTKKGLTRWREGKAISFSQRDGLLSNFVTALTGDSRGRLWIGTDKGLHLLEGNTIKPWKNRGLLASIYVTAILEDRDGNLWVGTRGGLNRIQGDQVATLTDRDGLSNNYIWTLFQDMEGSLWIGSGGGLDQLRDGKLTAFSKKEGLASDYITCIHEDSQGGLWIGNGERGIDFVKGGITRNISTRDGLAHNNVSAIWSGRDKSVWIGTFGGGVNRLQDGVFSLYDSASGLSSNYINAIYQDSREDVWVGTEGGGVNRLRSGRIEWISKDYDLPGKWISFFHEDRSGNLWIGTEDVGLYRFRNGRFDHFTTRDGLSDNNLTSMYEDEEGNLWLGTRRNGISLFRDGRFSNISRVDGLFQDTVYHILEDQRNNLWMSSPKGIFTVNRLDLLAFAAGRIRSFSCTIYGKSEGMRNIQCVGHSLNSGCKDHNGRLWFPTMEGVVMADPAHIQINKRPPKVKIEEFIVDGRGYEVNQKVELPPGRKNFEFHYTALLLAAPEKIQFKYQLQGFDQDWIDAKNRRVAFYTAINPGDYRFRVIARNNDGVWNETGDVLSFYLKPFFFQTGWFLFACGLFLVGVGFSFYQIRVASLEKKHRELAHLVQERTQQLEGEKEKLEKANTAKSEFLSFAVHDLRNPLQTITGYAEIIESESTASVDIRYKAQKVMQAAKRMLGLIDELMQSSIIESGQIAFNPKPINVDDLTQRIIQSYQSFAESKGQRLMLSTQAGLITFADEQLLQQAFENLLSNAVKFSPGGKQIWISLTAPGDMLRFSVKDEGPGLSEEDRRKIFGRFQRLTARPTGGESSTGLGLFIAKQLVELHHGRIWVDSGPGAGSTFTIELPRIN